MAQSVGILGLPDDVLGRICSQFCPHCVGEDCLGGFMLPGGFGGPEYFGTLANLTQVNVRIGRAAQAVRFHVFCARRDSLPRLARTLVEHPALAANIRVVRLGDRDKDTDDRCILRELATLLDVNKLKSLVLPSLDPDFDILCLAGEERLLAPFKHLPPIEDSFFSDPRVNDIVLGVRGDGPPTWASADAPVAMERIANARLNAFLLFKLAKKIESIAILSEWPLALFPEVKPSRKIKVKRAQPTATSAVDPGSLPKVEQLRLDSSNENPHRRSHKSLVDIRKSAGLITHLPKLRKLEIRGGHGNLSSAQVTACRPVLGNVTDINLIATGSTTMDDILLCCKAQSLKHFGLTIPARQDGNLRHGSDLQGSKVVSVLEQCGLHKTLESLCIDTSESAIFALDPDVLRRHENFTTVPTLAHFSSLRRLSISAENIYYPSLLPRVLLRDDNTGDEHSASRLAEFLPRRIESIEIVGIYAINFQDVAHAANECHDGKRLPRLKRVILRGLPNDSSVILPISRCKYPVPTYESKVTHGGNLRNDPVNWFDVEQDALDEAEDANKKMAGLYEAAGAEYEFDRPDFFSEQYAGDWDKDPEA